MPSKFNPQAVIAAYNINQPTRKIPTTEHWKLKCLKAGFVDFLQRAEKLLENLLTLETTEENSRHTTYQIKKRLAKGTYKRVWIDDAKWNPSQEKLQEQVLFRMAWEKAWHKRLSNPATWVNIRETKEIVATSEVLALQKLWKHPELHRKSHKLLTRILLLVNHTLPFLHFAFQEVTRSKALPASIATVLKNQLNEQIAHFKNIKKQALFSMGTRLQVSHELASTQSDLNGDIIAYTVTRLQQLNKIPISTSSFVPAKPLSKTDFHLFKRDIENYGHDDLKASLAKQLAAKSKVYDASELMLLDGEYLVIPDNLKTYMPSWSGWPAWLFAGRHARINFFKKQQFAFARLKQPLPDLPMAGESDDEKSSLAFLDRLNSHEAFLIEERKQAEKMPSSLLQGDYRELLRAWQTTLDTHRYRCTLKRLDYLNYLINLPLPREPAQLQPRASLIRYLQIKLDEGMPLKGVMLERYQRLKLKWQKNEPDPLLTTARLIEQLADGDTDNKTFDWEMLDGVLKTLSLSSTLESCSDTATKEAASKQILKLLEKNTAISLGIDSFELLSRYGRIVKYLSAGAHQPQLDIWLESLIIHQMLHCKGMAERNTYVSMQAVEKLIHALGSPKLREQLAPLAMSEKSIETYRHVYMKMLHQFSGAHIDTYADHEIKRIEEYVKNRFSQLSESLRMPKAVEKLSALMVEKGIITIHHLESSNLQRLALESWEATQEGRTHPEVRALIELRAKAQLTIRALKTVGSYTEKVRVLSELASATATPHLKSISFFRKRFPIPEKAPAIQQPQLTKEKLQHDAKVFSC